jgi:hypothetical protein
MPRANSFEAAAQEVVEGNAEQSVDGERIEEQRAELAIPEPGPAVPVSLDGSDVDECRFRPYPLDVLGGAVLRDQPILERRFDEIEV